MKDQKDSERQSEPYNLTQKYTPKEERACGENNKRRSLNTR